MDDEEVPRILWNGNIGNLRITDTERARVAEALKTKKANMAMCARTDKGDTATLYYFEAPGCCHTVEPMEKFVGCYMELTWLCFTVGTPSQFRCAEITKTFLMQLPGDYEVVLSLVRSDSRIKKLKIPADTMDEIEMVSWIMGDEEYNKPSAKIIPIKTYADRKNCEKQIRSIPVE